MWIILFVLALALLRKGFAALAAARRALPRSNEDWIYY